MKIRVVVEVNHAAGADYRDTVDGPPRSEWEAMTEKEREAYLEEVAGETLANQVSTNAWVEDEDEEDL